MISQVKAEVVECKYRGPWVISRDVWIGQTCWHPENLKDSHTHLFSKCCEEWGDDCPAHRKGPQGVEAR
ncbi:MAG: hypothetical protein A2Z21_03345 [Candidatus Fraserbacteria bacterium RBG_16_55_9]|uniref:Uncharacterized protein n=1 Tax=Fraserbacteria sp. (strain RBG_16_55_9) TaxID=1817864 RepID=A0A1F5UPJ0_FRAXR|nr:MAG: hypothetical protein A2Z21_03345 [Candidatus Fraserbacteria bacterium RBG_16_55_9]